MTDCTHPMSRVFTYDDRQATEHDLLYGQSTPLRMHCYVCGRDLTPDEVEVLQKQMARLLGTGFH